MSGDAAGASATRDLDAQPTPDGADTVARDTRVSFAAHTASAALSAVLTVFLARKLGPEGYGLFALATSVGLVVLVAADSAISASAARFTARRRGRVREAAALYVDALKLKLVAIGAVCLLLAVLAAPIADAYGDRALAWPLRAIAVATFAQSLVLLGAAFLSALGGVVIRLRAAVAESVVEVSASIALVLLGGGVTGAAFGRAIGYGFGAALSIALALAVLGRPPRGAVHAASANAGRVVGRHASALLAVDVSSATTVGANVLLLGGYVGSAASGVFQAPSRLLAPLAHPALFVADRIASRPADRPGQAPDADVLTAALRGLIAVQCLFLAPAVVWARPITDLVLGSGYARSADVLRALAPYLFLTGLAPLLAIAIGHLGEARRSIAIALATLALTVAAGVTLIPDHGVVGAAIGTDIAYGFYTLAQLWLCGRVLGLRLAPIALSLGCGVTAASAMGIVLWQVGLDDLTALDWIVGVAGGGAAYLATLIFTREVRVRDVIRVLRAAKPDGGARLREPRPAATVREETAQPREAAVFEIAWRPLPGHGIFELAPLAQRDDGTAAAATSRRVQWGWRVLPPPNPDARRAHSELVGDLLEDGWEPCGRGDAWFAERFRRPTTP